MRKVLTPMLRRLSTPQVALKLTKEELCLSLAAIAKLQVSPSSWENPIKDVQMLSAKAIQVAPHANGLELGMISSFASLLLSVSDGSIFDAVLSRVMDLEKAMRPEDLAFVLRLLVAGVCRGGVGTKSSVYRSLTLEIFALRVLNKAVGALQKEGGSGKSVYPILSLVQLFQVAVSLQSSAVHFSGAAVEMKKGEKSVQECAKQLLHYLSQKLKGMKEGEAGMFFRVEDDALIGFCIALYQHYQLSFQEGKVTADEDEQKTNILSLISLVEASVLQRRQHLTLRHMTEIISAFGSMMMMMNVGENDSLVQQSQLIASLSQELHSSEKKDGQFFERVMNHASVAEKIDMIFEHITKFSPGIAEKNEKHLLFKNSERLLQILNEAIPSSSAFSSLSSSLTIADVYKLCFVLLRLQSFEEIRKAKDKSGDDEKEINNKLLFVGYQKSISEFLNEKLEFAAGGGGKSKLHSSLVDECLASMSRSSSLLAESLTELETLFEIVGYEQERRAIHELRDVHSKNSNSENAVDAIKNVLNYCQDQIEKASVSGDVECTSFYAKYLILWVTQYVLQSKNCDDTPPLEVLQLIIQAGCKSCQHISDAKTLRQMCYLVLSVAQGIENRESDKTKETKHFSPRHILWCLQAMDRSLIRDPDLLSTLLLHLPTNMANITVSEASGILSCLDARVGTHSKAHQSIREQLIEKLHGGSGLETTALPNLLLDMVEKGEEITEEVIVKLASAVSQGEWDANDLAKIVTALTLAKRDSTAFVGMLLGAVDQLTMSSVALLFTAMARSVKLRNALLDKICEHALQVLSHANNCAQAMIAFSKLNAPAEYQVQLLPAFANRLAASLRETSVREACLSLETLSRLPDLQKLVKAKENSSKVVLSLTETFHPDSLMKTCGFHFLAQLESCDVREICMIIKVFGLFDFVHDKLFDAIDNRLAMEVKSIARNQNTTAMTNNEEEVPSNQKSGSSRCIWDDFGICTEFLSACVILDHPSFEKYVDIVIKHVDKRLQEKEKGSTSQQMEGSQQSAATAQAAAYPELMSLLPSYADTTRHLLCQQILKQLPKFGSAECVELALGLKSDNIPAPPLPSSEADTSGEEGVPVQCQVAQLLMKRVNALLEEGVPFTSPQVLIILQHAAKFNAYLSFDDVKDLFEWLSHSLNSLRPGELSELIECMAKLRMQGRESFVQPVASQWVEELDQLSVKQIVQGAFTLARLGLKRHTSVFSLSEYCVDHSFRFNLGRDMVRLLHAFGRMAHTNRNIYNVFAAKLKKRPVLIYMKKQDISMAFSAFGDARYLDEELFRALGRKAVKFINELGAIDVALIAHSLSQLYLLSDSLYEALAERAKEVSDEFTPHGAMMVINAFGKMNNVEHAETTECLIEALIPKLSMIEPTAVAEMLKSLCLMEYSNQEHWSAFGDYITQNVHQLPAQGLHDLCCVMQTLNWRDDKLLLTIGDQSVRLSVSNEMTPETARVVLDTLSLFLHYHPTAREQLTDAARSVSRDTLPLETGQGDTSDASLRAIGY